MGNKRGGGPRVRRPRCSKVVRKGRQGGVRGWKENVVLDPTRRLAFKRSPTPVAGDKGVKAGQCYTRSGPGRKGLGYWRARNWRVIEERVGARAFHAFYQLPPVKSPGLLLRSGSTLPPPSAASWQGRRRASESTRRRFNRRRRRAIIASTTGSPITWWVSLRPGSLTAQQGCR
jgi:hypothetical protein